MLRYRYPPLRPPDHRVKPALVSSLRQYNGQQTRFNHHIVLYARRLEDRVAELEQRVAAVEREKGRGDEA